MIGSSNKRSWSMKMISSPEVISDSRYGVHWYSFGLPVIFFASSHVREQLQSDGVVQSWS